MQLGNEKIVKVKFCEKLCVWIGIVMKQNVFNAVSLLCFRLIIQDMLFYADHSEIENWLCEFIYVKHKLVTIAGAKMLLASSVLFKWDIAWG